MKLLSQFIEQHLPGANLIQLIAAIGLAMMLLNMLVNKYYCTIKNKISREKKKLDKVMWAIE